MPEDTVVVRMRVYYIFARILRTIIVRVLFVIDDSEHNLSSLIGSPAGDLLILILVLCNRYAKGKSVALAIQGLNMDVSLQLLQDHL